MVSETELPCPFVNVIYYLVETAVDFSSVFPRALSHRSRTIIKSVCEAYSNAGHFYIFEGKLKLLQEYIAISC